MASGCEHAEPAGAIGGHAASPAPRAVGTRGRIGPPRAGHQPRPRAGPAPHGALDVKRERRDLHQPDRECRPGDDRPSARDTGFAAALPAGGRRRSRCGRSGGSCGVAGDVTRAARGILLHRRAAVVAAGAVGSGGRRGVAGDVTRAAILPGNRIEVLVYGCTSGRSRSARARIARLIRAARPGLPCSNPISAALAACASFRARDLVADPLYRPVNDALAHDLRSRGLEVMTVAGFALERHGEMTAGAAGSASGRRGRGPRSARRAAVRLLHRAAHEPGRGLAQERLGKPVNGEQSRAALARAPLGPQCRPVAGFGASSTGPLPA